MKVWFAAAALLLVAGAMTGLRVRPMDSNDGVSSCIKEHAAGEIVIPAEETAFRQAQGLILSPGRLDYSLLWLEALGAGHLVSGNATKYGQALESELCDPGGPCVYLGLARRPTPAVVVSRRLWRALPRLRSLYHRAALQAYIEWADRPEAAGFHWNGPRAAELRVDLGPDDVILVREPARRWSATLDGRPLECFRDPIGYLVLDPGRGGWVTIQLTATHDGGAAQERLPVQTIPAIAGVVGAMRGTPPPFVPGGLVAIYGTDLNAGRSTRVLIGGRQAGVLYASDQQVNIRIPELPAGAAELVVEAGGAASDPVTIDRAR